MEIRNTSKGPLKVPLPGGKRLFLAVGATGNVTAKAADHPPLKALVEAGDLEVTGGAARGASATTERGGKSPALRRGGPRAGGRRSGDR